jgi:hypothetical protein
LTYFLSVLDLRVEAPTRTDGVVFQGQLFGVGVWRPARDVRRIARCGGSGWLLARERTKPMEEARDMSSSRMDVAADSSMDEGLEVEPTSPPASCREPALEGWTGKEAAHLWETPFRVW